MTTLTTMSTMKIHMTVFLEIPFPSFLSASSTSYSASFIDLSGSLWSVFMHWVGGDENAEQSALKTDRGSI